MRLLSTLLEILGMALFLAGAYLIDWRVGAALTGVLLVVVGFLLDRPQADG